MHLRLDVGLRLAVAAGSLVLSLAATRAGAAAGLPSPQCTAVCTPVTACATPCALGTAWGTCGSQDLVCTEYNPDRAHLFRFRMLTLNSWLLDTPLGIGAAPDRACRARQIGDALAGHDYDLVVLQEGFDRKNVDALIARAKYPYRYSRYPRPRGLEKSGGLGILSLLPIAFQHNEPWVSAGGSDAFAQKGFLHARLRHPSMDAPLDVVTVHLNANYGSRLAFREVRRHQTVQLADELGRYPASTLIVAGDFNVIGPPALPGNRDDNAEYQETLRANLPWTLRDAWLVKRPREYGFTLDECTNSYRSGNCSNDSGHRRRIDQIFFDDQRNCYALELVDVFVHEFREPPGTGCPKDHLSDHFGVGAVFDVWRKAELDWPTCLPPDPDQPGNLYR